MGNVFSNQCVVYSDSCPAGVGEHDNVSLLLQLSTVLHFNSLEICLQVMFMADSVLDSCKEGNYKNGISNFKTSEIEVNFG